MKYSAGIIILLLLTSGCNNTTSQPPVVKVGSIEISKEEFTKAFQASGYEASDRIAKNDFLDAYIVRKLILKEAESLGINKNPEFLDDIQFFWEQSLLKRTIAQESIQLLRGITISDAEIAAVYNDKKDTTYKNKDLASVYQEIKFLILRTKEQQAIQNWIGTLRKKTPISVDYKRLGLE